MLKIFLIGFSSIVISLVMCGGAFAQDDSAKSDEPVLSASIKISDGAVLTTDSVPINFIFRNTGPRDLRILDVFEFPSTAVIFFRPRLTDSEGTPIQLMGGGKVSLSRDSIKYKELKPEQEYEIQLDLKNFVPRERSLKEGNYNLVFEYYNQYGDDCFRGRLESNSVNLTIN